MYLPLVQDMPMFRECVVDLECSEQPCPAPSQDICGTGTGTVTINLVCSRQKEHWIITPPTKLLSVLCAHYSVLIGTWTPAFVLADL